MIKITKEQGTSAIPINAPVPLQVATPYFKKGFEFPITMLVNVHYNPEKAVKKDGIETPTPVLGFTFVDATNTKKTNTHYEYPIESTDDKYATKLAGMTERIKHIFDEALGKDKFKEEDFQGGSFSEFFANVEKAFNKYVVTIGEGDEAKSKKMYATEKLYLKLGFNKSYVTFPLFPNFVQKAFVGGKQQECTLGIDPKYDKIVPQVSASSSSTTFAIADDFGGGFDDLPQM